MNVGLLWRICVGLALALAVWPATAVLAAPTDCLGSPTRQITYTSDGVVHLKGCGQVFTLTQVAAASAVGPTRLELVDQANKVWLLKTNLKVEEGAMLVVTGGPSGDANWLRLRSDNSAAVWLRSDNGTVRFDSTRVTSWNPATNTYDTDYTTAGRAYIAVRSIWTSGRETAPPTTCDVNGGSQEPYEARLDVVNSEIAYLGSSASESYGIVWKVYSKTPPPGRQLYDTVDIFGTVTGSRFHHNYYGAYTYGAYCMRWTGNTFEQNIKYGLDPHDDSDYLTIDSNIFRDNGDHGVICSQYCNNLIISNNQSYRNVGHGIMLHRNVTNSIVERNTSSNNTDSGIAIFDSHDNIIRDNIATGNVIAALRLSVGASGNLIENNTLTGPPTSASGSGYAIYSYKGSDPPTTGDGRPKNNTFRGNRINGYKSLVVKLGDATNNSFEGNTVGGPTTAFEFANGSGNVVASTTYSTTLATHISTKGASSLAGSSVVRDSQVGNTLTIKLDTYSSTTLQDTRHNIWLLPQTGLSTNAGPANSTLSLTYASVGGTESITTLDFRVSPGNGSVAVRPTTWQTAAPYAKAWAESSANTTGPVAHAVGNLLSGACYNVTANNSSIGLFIADGGRIDFAYSNGYNGTISFAVKSAAGC